MLITRQDGPVRLLQLHRPEAKNALDFPLVQALGSELERADQAPDVRALVLTGSGGAFCAGADLKAAITEGPALFDNLPQRIDAFHVMIRAIANMSKPVVAAVGGAAVGYGCDLALACDLRLISPQTYFQEKFVNIGLMPDGGGTFHLPRLIGMGKALEMMLLGEPIHADEAVRLGMANRIVAEDQLLDEALTLAHRLAKGPPIALAQIKRSVRQGLSGTLEEALDREKAGQVLCLRSRDALEGIAAWAQKRDPSFEGT